MSELTLFDVFDISPTATLEEVKAAYRKKARLNHPDFAVNEVDKAGRTEQMAAINVAYETLGDKHKLEVYRQSLRDAFEGRQNHRRPDYASAKSSQKEKPPDEMFLEHLQSKNLTISQARSILRHFKDSNKYFKSDKGIIYPSALLATLNHLVDNICSKSETYDFEEFSRQLSNFPRDVVNVDALAMNFVALQSAMKVFRQNARNVFDTEPPSRRLVAVLNQVQILQNVVGIATIADNGQMYRIVFSELEEMLTKILTLNFPDYKTLQKIPSVFDLDILVAEYLFRNMSLPINMPNLPDPMRRRYLERIAIKEKEERTNKMLSQLRTEMKLHRILSVLDELSATGYEFEIDDSNIQSPNTSYKADEIKQLIFGAISLLQSNPMIGKPVLNNTLFGKNDLPASFWDTNLPGVRRILSNLSDSFMDFTNHKSLANLNIVLSNISAYTESFNFMNESGVSEQIQPVKLRKVLDSIMEILNNPDTDESNRKDLQTLLSQSTEFLDIDIFLYHLIQKKYPPSIIKNLFGMTMLSKPRHAHYLRTKDKFPV